MISIAEYHRFDDAVMVAARLQSHGIHAQAGGAVMPSMLPGVGGGFEVEISPEDFEKFEELMKERRGLLIVSERKCPKCNEAAVDYVGDKVDGDWFGRVVLGFFIKQKRGHMIPHQKFKCGACGHEYEEDMTKK